MKYQKKLEIKLTDLQKLFFRLFRKAFPDLVRHIELKEGIISQGNLCFSVKSVSELFGSIDFDIDDEEITVFTPYNHTHFPTYFHEEEKDRRRRLLLTSANALDYIRDLLNGSIIIECQQQGDKVLTSVTYHKDDPKSIISITKNLDETIANKSSFLLNLKNFFREPEQKPILIKKVNWFGNLN